MTPQMAQAAGQFLQRVTLQPQEIQMFQQVAQALQAEAQAPAPAPLEAPPQDVAKSA